MLIGTIQNAAMEAGATVSILGAVAILEPISIFSRLGKNFLEFLK